MENAALNSIKNHIKNSIAYARYKIGSTYYRAEIANAQVLSDGKIAKDVQINSELSGNITITEIQLYDHNGNLWDKKIESISRSSTQEGILYRFAYTIKSEDV